MRLLPYSKRLLDRRAAGERPWLVVVTMGSEPERKLVRGGIMPEDKDAARIWVPDDFRIDQADLHWALGLDVFVAPFCDCERFTQFMVMLWRARVATLWQLDAGFTGTRLYPIPPRGELVAFVPEKVKLDGDFRRRVVAMREQALLVADEPLFNDPIFSEQRLKLLAA